MAVTYLEHPVHGQMAFGDLDAAVALANGWTPYDPTPVKQEVSDSLPAGLPAFLGGSDLPAEFPGRHELIDGGLHTWASLQGKTVDDFEALKGIGKATAKAIVRALDV